MAVAVAFIPFAAKAILDPAAIAADFATRFADAEPLVVEPSTKEGFLSFQAGDQIAIVAPMGGPIPWGDLEGPCQSSILWPDAATVLRDHADHLIVTVMGPTAIIERCALLTRVIASVLATSPPALGVFWSPARLLIPAPVFGDFAVEVLPDGPPLDIWVDFRVGTTSPGKSSGFTTGLAALGLMEIEAEGASDTPTDLRARFISLANYLLENGPVVNNGDTIGEDAHERIQVIHAPSSFGHDGPVMRLDYTPLKPRKSWFGRN